MIDWRKEMGVEPTGDRMAAPSGFEGAQSLLGRPRAIEDRKRGKGQKQPKKAQGGGTVGEEKGVGQATYTFLENSEGKTSLSFPSPRLGMIVPILGMFSNPEQLLPI